ncbi:hypothetical protein Pcinc_000079 [Petrolisthes cinctipes]|uniref:Aspartyl/asparaginy/proline hydroxylase domain-containing protein n=1 Tax=Petrolisthes cinctipes TaxID=88211 RepID=A0AAE1L541_PETCI|nr:hypothetical protein Pcinc_000079 [Petrolisthes cinctipes]
MGLRECCSTFLAALPNPSLPLLHSFVLGTVFSAIILFYVYSKESKLGLKKTMKLLIKNLFYALPSPLHLESQVCHNPDCVRCHKYQELMVQMSCRWKKVKEKNPKLELKRVKEAVQNLDQKSNPPEEIMSKEQKDKYLEKKEKKKPSYLEFQKPTLFHMDLPANPYWSDLDVYGSEIELLKLNFQIILKEFKYLFEALQNGYHSGWKLNDIETGHWCIFPLLDQGTINEANCSRCPNTAALLGSLPALMKDCVFGNVCFSVLYPDSIIKPHYGPSNIRLRCHLGLDVPAGCKLEVAGERSPNSSAVTNIAPPLKNIPTLFPASVEHHRSTA